MPPHRHVGAEKPPAISIGLRHNLERTADRAVGRPFAFELRVACRPLTYHPRPARTPRPRRRSGLHHEIVVSPKAGCHMWPGPLGSPPRDISLLNRRIRESDSGRVPAYEGDGDVKDPVEDGESAGR